MSKASDMVRENFKKGDDPKWQILDVYRPKAEEGKNVIFSKNFFRNWRKRI